MSLGSGLFDGFESYLTPSSEDYRQVLTGGLVVLDTNALLNLYRYTEETREDLLRVLERLGEALWVPSQVISEFWTNRERVMRGRPRNAQEAIEKMRSNEDASLQTVRSWANRVSLPDDVRDDLLARLAAIFHEVTEAIEEESRRGAILPSAHDTAKDPVLARLGELLKGRVGPAYDNAAHAAAVEEANRRKLLRIPPGYMDESAGDYLVWEQTLQRASECGKDVLFITGDVKEDWWREEGGERRGPREELFNELKQRAGVRLFMLRPASLLITARTLLSIEIHDRSLIVAKRVDELPVRRGEVRRLIAMGDYDRANPGLSVGG